MTAVITGITGQMGSYYAEFLLEKGFKVIGTVRRLSIPNTKNIEGFKGHKNLILEPMDLGDSHSIHNVIVKYKPDYFINCAANSFVGNSWICPEQHMNYNALGVLRQLEEIRKHSPHTRYLNFGSSEEMGDVLYSPQDEKHPPRARSVYAVSKIASRQICKVYRESYGIIALQCWCYNYESKRRGEEFVTRKITKGVARICKSLRRGETPEPIILGNIYSSRDWSHAIDFVKGTWLMINQDILTEEDKLFNKMDFKPEIREFIFSSGETHSIKEFIEKAFRYGGLIGEWEGEGLEEVFVETYGETRTLLVKIDKKFFRPNEVSLLHGNSSLAKEYLGWEPQISFDLLIKEMVNNDIAQS